MGSESTTGGYELPERGPNIVKNWWDTIIIFILLQKRLTRKQTLGNLIEMRGIKQKYILGLCGRYDVVAIKKYANSLGDRRGQSVDEIADTNPEFDGYRPQ